MNRTDYPRLDERVFRTRLDNGLKIAVVPRPGFARKAAYFVTDYGSIHTEFTHEGIRYSAPAGVAHYLEHKMFDMPDMDVSEAFAALGANPNAFTSYDMTAYYFTCTEHFDECLELLLKFESTPYFTEESVRKEQGIIAQEILMYNDSADSRVFEDLTENMYHTHPIRVPIAGTVESIEEITPEILELCHRVFYHPGNMMLCVVGDVDPEEVTRIAGEVLPAENQTPAQTHLGQEDMDIVRPLSVRQMDVAMPTFQLGIKCPPPPGGVDFARWELTAELAAEVLFGESSQLYLWLYEEGLIDSSFGGGVETVRGSAMITCGGDSYEPEQVRDCIFNHARYLVREGIPEDEFQRMKKSFLGRRIKDLDSFESTCFRLCAYEMEQFDYFRFPESFDSVTLEEVRGFLEAYILPERCAVAIVEPRKGKEN